MSIDLDPTILTEFLGESKGLVVELRGIIDRLEDTEGGFPDEALKDFAQRIDRIMGAAKTIGLLAPDHPGFKFIGTLTELCKSIGYQAAEKKQVALMPFFAAFLADAVDVVETLLDQIEDLPATQKTAREFAPVLQNRLAWLKSKIQG